MKSDKTPGFDFLYSIIASRAKNPVRHFYYGVKSTGIFCRPGCSSRLPKPENVIFFSTAEGALKAGFRPCKRCSPADKPHDRRSRLIIKVCR